MKTRDGFVSNSSSSSFIVAMDKDVNPEATITFKVDFSSYGKKIETIEELRSYMEYNYGSIDEAPDVYDDMKKAIDDGKVVLAGSFSDEGEATEAFLCDLGLHGNVDETKIQIIQSEGGY